MDLLVLIDEDQATDARCRAALEVLRVCGGHLVCLQATSPNALISSGSFGTAKMLAERAGEVERHQETLQAATRNRFAATEASWEYRRFEGDLAQTIIEQSRLVDLVVLNTERQASTLNNFVPSAAEVLSGVRVPVMALPAGAEGFNAAGTALVAWDGSAECAHALRNSLMMMKCASDVVVVTVEGERPGIRGEQAGAYLARHGVRAEVCMLPLGDRNIGGVLLEAVRTYRASYMVMGAFGHGRTREFLLGGVTRDMLKNCPVPLVLAH